MASALAWECYAQFGSRERSEANLLVSRKFMRDLLGEYQDLRAKDKARLVDRALLLSFLPTLELQDMVELSSTHVWKDREAVSLVPAKGYFARVLSWSRGRLGSAALVAHPGPLA